MSEATKTLAFQGGQSNYYMQDVEKLAAFYRENFGFKETYRTPKEGAPEHIEIRLGEYLIGLSSVEAAGAHYAHGEGRDLHPSAAQL